MADRDPHAVLGIERGATQTQIKAAWRRLARENHPDLTGKDPGSVRAATRRMAQINAAYERLREGAEAKRRRMGDRSEDGATDGDAADVGGRKRRGGPPAPKPTRPVTGRLDTSGTFRGRNRTTTPRGSRGHASSEPPPNRPPAEDREPPRASDPTGPLRRARIHRFRRTPLPDLSAAKAVEMEFGKFRGHTLGEIAAFEPSYIDWISSTISRDADLVAAARAIVDDLDRRGIVRRRRETERQQRDAERRRREWQRIFADRTGS
jgi:curved DNA-binding protein CbpA